MNKKMYKLKRVVREETITLHHGQIDGFRISPKNKIEYPGIQVNSMLLIKPALIDKLLKKKTKKTLEYYLQYLITMLDEENGEENARQALDNLTRFRGVVDYKYRKYLDDKYINLLLKKVLLLEQEIKNKIPYQIPPMQPIVTQPVYEGEKGKSR